MSEVIKNIPTVAEIQQKLIEKLRPSGWADFLKGHLQSSDFTKIIEYLVQENSEGRRFTPALKQLFTAFEKCPVDTVKVVIIGQDPYPYTGVASGLAFSCENKGKPEASLRYILGAIERTVPYENLDKVVGEEMYDLSRWAKQGVLLLNSALTTEVGKIGRHVDVWRPFMDYMVDMLNYRESGLIWIMMGKQAQRYEGLVGEEHHTILKCTHPAYAAYLKSSEWDCADVFNKCNKQLAEYKKDKILW